MLFEITTFVVIHSGSLRKLLYCSTFASSQRGNQGCYLDPDVLQYFKQQGLSQQMPCCIADRLFPLTNSFLTGLVQACLSHSSLRMSYLLGVPVKNRFLGSLSSLTLLYHWELLTTQAFKLARTRFEFHIPVRPWTNCFTFWSSNFFHCKMGISD